MKKFVRLALVAGAFCLSAAQAQTFPAPTHNASGTITTGGQFQVIAQQGAYKSIDFQNLTASDNCYLHIGADTATESNSLKIAAGYEYIRSSGTIPSDVIQATCDASADTYYLGVQ